MDSIDTDHLSMPGRVSVGVVGPGRPDRVAPGSLAPFGVMVERSRALSAGEVTA
jgi:hypothetical protein